MAAGPPTYRPGRADSKRGLDQTETKRIELFLPTEKEKEERRGMWMIPLAPTLFLSLPTRASMAPCKT